MGQLGHAWRPLISDVRCRCKLAGCWCCSMFDNDRNFLEVGVPHAIRARQFRFAQITLQVFIILTKELRTRLVLRSCYTMIVWCWYACIPTLLAFYFCGLYASCALCVFLCVYYVYYVYMGQVPEIKLMYVCMYVCRHFVIFQFEKLIQFPFPVYFVQTVNF